MSPYEMWLRYTHTLSQHIPSIIYLPFLVFYSSSPVLMKQKISKQTPPDTNSFQTKAVKSAQSMGKQIIPALYRKALAETFDDMRILEK
jgi:hypothetical protein